MRDRVQIAIEAFNAACRLPSWHERAWPAAVEAVRVEDAKRIKDLEKVVAKFEPIAAAMFPFYEDSDGNLLAQIRKVLADPEPAPQAEAPAQLSLLDAEAIAA